MRMTVDLVLIGGVLLILGLIQARVMTQRSRSTALPYAIIVLGVAILIAAGGHELLVHAGSTNPVRSNQASHYKRATYQQLQRRDFKQKHVATSGRVAKVIENQSTIPTFLLVKTGGTMGGVVVVGVTAHTFVSQSVTRGNHVTVCGICRGIGGRVGYSYIPELNADRIRLDVAWNRT